MRSSRPSLRPTAPTAFNSAQQNHRLTHWRDQDEVLFAFAKTERALRLNCMAHSRRQGRTPLSPRLHL